MPAALTNSRPLPQKPEQITREWLTEALQERYPGVEVTRATVRDVINGTSTKIRVALEYDGAGQKHGLPATLIVKGGFESHSQWMAGMYRDEMRFYRDAKPHLITDDGQAQPSLLLVVNGSAVPARARTGRST